MAQEDAAQPEMRKENQCIRICFFNTVIRSFPPVPVFGKQFIKGRDYFFICRTDTHLFQHFIFTPVFCGEKARIGKPFLWHPVPGDRPFDTVVFYDGNIKLPKPGADFRLSARFLQGCLGSLHRPSKRRYIVVFNLHGCNAARQKRRFPFSFFRQPVFFIVGLSVANQQDFHLSL